jgi:hypothetical protein
MAIMGVINPRRSNVIKPATSYSGCAASTPGRTPDADAMQRFYWNSDWICGPQYLRPRDEAGLTVNDQLPAISATQPLPQAECRARPRYRDQGRYGANTVFRPGQ